MTACSGTVEGDVVPESDAAADAAIVEDAATDTAAIPVDSSLTDALPDTLESDSATPDTAVAETPADAAAACPPTLKPGAEHRIAIDAFTGDEATAMPKSDANDGKAGDNPQFRRTNVARAHLFGEAYWFTSKHQEPGEPNPKGDQWVDYVPPFAKLGAGKYKVFMKYRAGENRATYPAKYVVSHAAGASTVMRDQALGGMVVTEFELGTFTFGCTGSIRAIDTGAESISFGAARFVYVGP